MENIAITVIAYNRKESLKRLLQTLSAAHFGEDKVPLYISVDKSDTDDVEKFADSYVWRFGEKHVVKHASNMGLRRHILSQGLLLDRYDAIIVLEDDLTVAPDFWNYAKQTVGKYKDDDQVAGISLYSFSINYQNLRPFIPMNDGNDVYFMNCAMSWGQVWMKRQWKEFYRWYDSNMAFEDAPHIPSCLYRWGDKSWLRYHTKYCIEKDKYFVFPYTSYTTNHSEKGTHVDSTENIFQVPLMVGSRSSIQLPDSPMTGIRYDGFFENKSLPSSLPIQADDCCLDLNGSNPNKEGKRYWLTSKHLPYRIVKKYGCILRPIEQNIFASCDGDDIFLYDTEHRNSGCCVKGNQTLLHSHYIQNPVIFIREYGLTNLVRDFIKLLVAKFS